jgi:hypothetical protein
MVDTIKGVLEGKGTLGLYELGLTPITIRTIGDEEHQIEGISDNGLIIDVYNDDGYSIDSYGLSYEDIKRNDLFELFDGIIEYYEDYSDDENDYM